MAIVAVEDGHEIAQDSSCMLAHSQGTSFRVVDVRNGTTAPAVGMCRAPKIRQTHVTILWYHVLVSYCRSPPPANKKLTVLVRMWSDSRKVIT